MIRGFRRRRSKSVADFATDEAIKLHSGDALVVHHSRDSRVVILEYEVHGKILSSGAPYDNRLISVITIKKSKDHPLARRHGLFGCLDGVE